MFLVKNEIGFLEDYRVWTECVSAGGLAAFLERKWRKPPRNPFGHPHFMTYVVENFGWNNPQLKVQKATRIVGDPEALFKNAGDEVEFAVLPYPESVSDDHLHMTITLVDDNAFANAVARAISSLEKTGSCELELQLIPDQV